METLNSICFSPDGTKIYAGSNKSIRCFTTEKPGKVCLQSKTFEKGVGGIKNVISTMAISPSSPTLLACGSYDGKVGLFSLEGRYMQMTPLTNDGSQPQPKGRDGCHCTLLLQGHSHTLKQKPTPAADAVVGQAPKARKIPCGVTQVQFTRNGMFLFSGARRNKRICCWDIRNTKRCLFSVERECRTNQRVLFDITPDDRLLATASQDGTVKLFDISQGGAEAGVIECGEVTNAVSFHPTRPLIAVTTGQHRFGIPSFSPLQDRPPLRFQSSSDNSSDSSSGLDREHMLKDDEGEQRVRFSPSDEEAEAEHAVPVSPFPITPFQRPVVKRGTPPIPSKNNLLLFQVTMTQTPQQPQTETPQQPPAETPCASIETLYQTPAEQPQQPSAEQPQQPPAETPCAPVEAPSTSDT
ncbi:putative telomerase Cajal body protein 1 [Blattamonas nauphoetae]|uniref:Telomerase Cajal body protein 1 n=1 Tax=Blattamonas nauphoetae TaxID=2049346 RepID=A0ABQ9XSK8_9EUKA|nr:putative telomerase Cajal body protein 1 [Blattamonas nauphoetae]